MKRLLALGNRGSLPPIVSLDFGLDRRTLISTHNGGTVYAWEETGGNLRAHSQSSVASDELDYPSFFTVDEEHPREIRGARWFPAKEGHSGLWACLDDYLIRGNEDDSIVVLPVSGAPIPSA